MVGSFGLAGPTPVVYLEPARDRSRLLAFTMVRKAVEHALSEAAKSCKAMIENHRGSIEALALRPAERGRVDDADVAEMIALAEHLALLVSLAEKYPVRVTSRRVSHANEHLFAARGSHAPPWPYSASTETGLMQVDDGSHAFQSMMSSHPVNVATTAVYVSRVAPRMGANQKS